jgi:hypothetical protein
VPIVEAGGEVIWIAGIRRGAAAPVTAATQYVLELALVVNRTNEVRRPPE